uniref:Uncharacterized protein n=1 Tax=uncultured Chromatiales bacterium HF0200_41F04 TaxID=710740 RepID=E0XV57_9GAMM|nr:hypothetical protein [uncultured Chromatiales bacterium HF0200_41F04]
MVNKLARTLLAQCSACRKFKGTSNCSICPANTRVGSEVRN